MNSTFNISIEGNSYFGYRLTVDSSTSSKMECQILVDGNPFESEINRSTSTSTGTMYVITEPTGNLSVGEHWSALQCRRLGGGNINVENIFCESCGEAFMATRVCEKNGKKFCIPCCRELEKIEMY